MDQENGLSITLNLIVDIPVIDGRPHWSPPSLSADMAKLDQALGRYVPVSILVPFKTLPAPSSTGSSFLTSIPIFLSKATRSDLMNLA